MRKFNNLLHRLASRFAKDHSDSIPGSSCRQVSPKQAFVCQSLEYNVEVSSCSSPCEEQIASMGAQPNSSRLQTHPQQQHRWQSHHFGICHWHSWAQGCHMRLEHQHTAARHLSASARGSSAQKPSRPGAQPRCSQPINQQQQQQRSARQPGPRQPSWQPRAPPRAGPSSVAASQESRAMGAFAPGTQRLRQGLQGPQQDPLSSLQGAGPSSKPFEGLNIEGDSDVRVVLEDSTHRVMPLIAALKLAKKERMDLMPVAPQAKPPVFRLGDANEAARQKRLRERESRRRELENRRKTLMKEVRIGPNTQENDLKVKLDKAKVMLDKKYRVRLFVPYQNKHRDAAVVMLQRLREMCAEFATVAGPELGEKLPQNTIIMYLTPKT